MQENCIIEELSNSFSQTSLLEPLSPTWQHYEQELDKHLELNLPLSEFEEQEGLETIVETPVNMVIQSVIDHPLPLPTLDQLESQLDNQPDLDRTDRILMGGDRLKQVWENTKYGGIFADYRPKCIPWKVEHLNRHEKLMEEEQDQESRVELLKKQIDRLKKLERNFNSTCSVHSAAIEDMRFLGEDINSTLGSYVKKIKALREELKKQLRWAKDILNQTKRNLKNYEDKENKYADETEERLRTQAKNLMTELKEKIKLVEDYETNEEDNLPVHSEEFVNLRMQWCGVINEMKRLKLGLPVGTYGMVESSKKILKRIESMERFLEIEKQIEIPMAKRRKLNPESEKL